jgi:hypothetical protein
LDGKLGEAAIAQAVSAQHIIGWLIMASGGFVFNGGSMVM